MLAVMGCFIRDVWPNATWMHQDNLEEVKIEICESVIVTLRTAARQEFEEFESGLMNERVCYQREKVKTR